MPVPLALMAVGTALQIFGNLQANYNQALAEEKNAEYYREQAEFVKESMFRESQLASDAYESVKGRQVSAIAKGGADLSGSAAAIVADTIAKKGEELAAIKRKGELDWKLATLRQRNSENAARELRDPVNNILQSATILTKNLSSNAEAGNMIFSSLGGKVRGNSGDVSPSPGTGITLAPESGGHFGSKKRGYLGDYNF